MKKIDTLIDLLYKIYTLLSNLQHFAPLHSLTDEQPMTRQQVKDYLGISESTYKRKVKDGTLKPLKCPGGDLYYKSSLIGELKESKNRGRI